MTTYPTTDETVAAAGLLENLQEKIAIASRAEKGKAPVTTGGDEVGVSGAVVAMESGGHREVVTQSACGWM